MHQLFVTYFGKQNQISQIDSTDSVVIIFVIIILLVILTIRRKTNIENTYLSLDTSKTLRGLAIILLILGHLAFKRIDGEQFFEYAGKWAVIIFLYISGVALTKTYGLAAVNKIFLWRRLKKLAVPTWIALGLYYSLDYLILDKSYSIKQFILNIFGIITLSPPSEAAWFVTYIIFLYLIYFAVSQIKLSIFIKIIIIFSISYVSTFFIWQNQFLCSHFYIWTLYSFVFPASVLIGLYREEIKRKLTKLLDYPICYSILIIIFSYQYFSETGVHSAAKLMNLGIFSQIIKTIHPVSLIIALVMISVLLDRIPFRSLALNWLGIYSFEIFLVHLPFMIYYDFFLFRKPLYFFFFVYLAVVLLLSILMKILSFKINLFIFNMHGASDKTLSMSEKV